MTDLIIIYGAMALGIALLCWQRASNSEESN